VVPRKVHVELRSKVSPTMFDPRAAEEIGASYELRLGEDRSRAEVAEGRFEVILGDADRPDATIETEPPVLVYDVRRLVEALRSGTLDIGGDGSAMALPYPIPTVRTVPTRHQGVASRARPAKLPGTSLAPSGYVHVNPFSGTRMYLL
jgi:hypothetical protein